MMFHTMSHGHGLLLALAVAGMMARCGGAEELGHAVSKFSDWKPPIKSLRRVSANILKGTLKEALQQTTREEGAIKAIEEYMAPTFKALPKNRHGLLSRNAAGFIVQKYFSQVHHFNIKGIGYEPATKEQDEELVHKDSILQSDAPELLLIELESRHRGRGLDLGDVAVMARTLHSMVLKSAASLLWQAYASLHELKMLPEGDDLSLGDLGTLFQTWVWVTKFDPQDYAALRHRLSDPSHVMAEFGEIAEDLALAQVHRTKERRNPFLPASFPPMVVMDLAIRLVEEMGPWQDEDCQVMKKSLRKLDAEGTGRVPLSTIFEQPEERDENNKRVFRFAESQDNLRETGSLDESDPQRPQLLISNFILGPPNCYRLASYYTYCCLNECEGLMGEIERVIQGPMAVPERLIELVGNLSSTSMDEPRVVSEPLREKLFATAKLHGGKVPLHGRLFAQWLHFAFPHECPFPHVTHKDPAGNALMTSFFHPSAALVAEATPALELEKEKVARNATSSLGAALLTQWSDDEFLPLVETQLPLISMEDVRRLLRLTFMMLVCAALAYHFRSVVVAGMRALGLRAPKKPVQGTSVFDGPADKSV